MIARFERRCIHVRAVQFDGTNMNAVQELVGPDIDSVLSLDGYVWINFGMFRELFLYKDMWLVMEDGNDFFVLYDKEFRANYVEVQ